jgi:hypothetical protein
MLQATVDFEAAKRIGNANGILAPLSGGVHPRRAPTWTQHRSFIPLPTPADPPPSAPARSRQETFDWVASTHGVARELRSDGCAVEVCLPPLRRFESAFIAALPAGPPDGPTPLPSCAACPDRAAPLCALLQGAAGGGSGGRRACSRGGGTKNAL